jgi:excisionase family DNA binding protein
MKDNKERTANTQSSLEVLSESQAARKLGLSCMTLQRARNRGQIGFYKVGRRVIYSIAHLLAFLTRFERNDSQTTEAEGE